MIKVVKPVKKSDKDLWEKIKKCIDEKNYIILPHTRKRQIDRNITDIDILDILDNRKHTKSKRNKKKDQYQDGFFDWNYCIEGLDIDKRKIRIIASFDEESNLLVITVVRLDIQES